MSADTEKKSARRWEDVFLSRAGEVARTGDRWFVAVATDFADAGRWARREADVIGDSMSAAFKTTMAVAKKMKPGSGAPEPEPEAEPEPPPPSPPARPINIDLLTALGEVGVPRQVAESELASHRAGIAPLLSALNEVVSSRKDGGYESLQSDERFWALVKLIHEHGEKAAMGGAAEPVRENERSR